MAKDSPGSSISRRLMQRAEGSLSRRSMGDGGEVVSGPMASRALKAIGARAMTMDHTIFVDEDFDASSAEDQALYAHERHHQMESGGTDDHGARDSEEIAARSIERMVLHRSAKGDDFGAIMRDVNSGNVPSSGGGSGGGGGDAGGDAGDGMSEDEQEAMAAYQMMIAKGIPHEVIVRQLARFVVDALAQSEEDRDFRTSPGSRLL